MKLATFQQDHKECVGVAVDETHIVELRDAYRVAGQGAAPATMMQMIAGGAEELKKAERAREHVAKQPGSAIRHDIKDVHWLAPVTTPGKICCLALNNSANSERIKSGPKHPAFFTKPSSALTGHNAEIECRPDYGRVHPEPELAVIIGKRGRDISASSAYDYVFGYTIHNDITAPIMRGEDTFHYRAIHPSPDNPNDIQYIDTHVSYPGRYKGSDTFSPMGPFLVTKDEIANPHDLVVSCHHKGELVTEDNTENLFYKIPETLAFISHYMALVPGDVISMGTALKRTGGGRAVQNVDLNKHGGPVSVTIQGLGTLINTVRYL
jgi:2-keto-4-pentenoate hydratase/2-oxohepta-3-ene-1,7-dioic acid hydratase in catechol pathway